MMRTFIFYFTLSKCFFGFLIILVTHIFLSNKKPGKPLIVRAFPAFPGQSPTVSTTSLFLTFILLGYREVRAEKERLVPDCSKCPSPCGKTAEYNMQQLWNADEDIRSLKSLILFGIRGMSAYAYLANVLDYEDDEVNRFFCEALFRIGYEESVETLLPTVLKVGEIHLKCMALLDKANTELC